RRYKTPLSLVTLDIDRFRGINETFGHGVGDLVLKAVAETCTREARRVDLVARLGGEGVAVRTPLRGLSGAAVLAERIRKRAEATELNAAGSPVKFTLSLGVAAMSAELQVLEELISTADRAMALAKGLGRNRVELASRRP